MQNNYFSNTMCIIYIKKRSRRRTYELKRKRDFSIKYRKFIVIKYHRSNLIVNRRSNDTCRICRDESPSTSSDKLSNAELISRAVLIAVRTRVSRAKFHPWKVRPTAGGVVYKRGPASRRASVVLAGG